MVVIYNLPDEIIEAILTNEEVSIKDIVNFSSTCKKFLEINYNNIFWMKKFSQRWPSAKKVYDEQNGNEKLNQVDFKKHIKIAIECIKQMRHYMSSLLEENYYYNDCYNNDIADIYLKCHLVNNSWKYYILMDELNRNLFTQSLQEGDLTQKYYSIKIFQYLLRVNLTEKWKIFINRPKQQKLLEEIIFIMIQWYQPNKYICFSYIKTLLDKIVNKILMYLEKEHPQHSIFSMSCDNSVFLKQNNINGNYWNETEAKQIKCILDKIIFDLDYSYELLYPMIKSNKEDLDIANLIRKDNNLDIIFWKDAFLLIIYHSVARRLGIHCKLVEHMDFQADECSSLIHIVWKANNTNNDEYFYNEWVPDMPIVIQKKCQIFSETYSKISLLAMACCWSYVPYIEHLLTENYLEITPILRELRSLEGHVIDRRNKNKLLIDRIAILIEKEHRQRSEKIIFAVGMIVIHQDERNDKVGVIIGWHDRKNQNAIYYRHQESFMSLCKCVTISEGFDPHYLILHDNNEICYIPQSSIKAICRTPKWINNSEIGRYFCKFEGTYYVPNEMLAKHYPNDAAVVLNMISKQ
ncbi:F-box only protein 21-like isoform X1 [Anoplolepis gracilipes]|uniref:F-box only protein 21-like isoform X1 n=2 Tax=Anoplolepis gracilipes TaxID=354296 RepID=UPI003BA1C26D